MIKWFQNITERAAAKDVTRTQAIKKLVLTGTFLGIGFVLPFFTGQIQLIGKMLLPMHLPVLLCGLLCGWKYGLALGLVLPVSRSLLFGMPLLYPSAVAMSFELAVYGFAVGFLFSRVRKRNLFTLYGCLLPSMLLGRITWGLAQTVLLGLGNKQFPFSAFLAGAFFDALPGIILQLILIPAILIILDRTRLISFFDRAQNIP